MPAPACTDPKGSIFRGQSSRRNYTGGFRSWLPATCMQICADSHPGDILITIVKETVVIYEKKFRKNEKMKPFRISQLLGRASSEPHSYVLTWLSVTIYIGIDGPTSLFDPAPGAKVGCCGQNLRVVTLCANDLLYWYAYMFLHIVFEFVTDRTCRSLVFDCQPWTTVQKISGLRNWMPSSQRNRTFFCLRASRHRNMFFYFPIFLRIEKASSTKQRYHCNSLSCKLLPLLIDNSATKGFFFFLTDNWVTLVFHTQGRC